MHPPRSILVPLDEEYNKKMTEIKIRPPQAVLDAGLGDRYIALYNSSLFSRIQESSLEEEEKEQYLAAVEILSQLPSQVINQIAAQVTRDVTEGLLSNED